MSRLEDRLRDAFRADAETVRPETIPGLARPRAATREAGHGRHPSPAWAADRALPTRRTRRQPRPRRARRLVPLATAVAVAACVAGVSLAFPHPNGHGPGPASSSATGSRGIPKFYANVYVAPGQSLPINEIIVRDTATGRVTGQIDPPRGTAFAGLAATADDRTFITALTPTSAERYVQGGETSLPNGQCTSQLYEFRLNNQGLPGPLVSLHITLPEVVSQGAGDLAITPDGRTIAYYAWCPVGSNKLESELGVINLATRHATVWSDNYVNFPNLIESLSLSADGRLLGFGTVPDGARVLNTSSPPGALLERSRVVPRAESFVALANDGASVYGCAEDIQFVHGKGRGVVNLKHHSVPRKPPPPNVKLTYYSVSVTTGRQRIIARLDKLSGPSCWASLDPAGRYLLIEFAIVLHGASAQSPAVLDLQTGRLAAYVDAPSVYPAFDISW